MKRILGFVVGSEINRIVLSLSCSRECNKQDSLVVIM